jgi:tetratricopeptide (TPR) repeat protein
MHKQAIELCKILVEVHPSDARAFTVYADFLNQEKNFKEAREYYRTALSFDKKPFAVWEQLIVMDYELHDFETLLKDTQEAETLFPTQPIVYFFKGVSKSQTDKNEEAVEVYKTGLQMVVDNKPLEEQFYANLGDAYFKLKNYKLSDESYEKALEIKPKDGYVLNNYSYYLSLRGEKLEKAATMSKLSNEVEPNSASKEDTYGWILYKQEKYAEAKIWVLKALEHGGTKDAVILEHLGDINFKLGDVQGAIEYWQKAKNGEGKPSEFLDKKITDKKLYE